MALAYNLTRLVFLEVEQGIKVSFAAGAQTLRATPWQHLEELYAAYRGRSTPKPGVLPEPAASASAPPPGPPSAPAPA